MIEEIRIRKTPHGYSPEVKRNGYPAWMAVNENGFTCNNRQETYLDAAKVLGRFIGFMAIQQLILMIKTLKQ